MHPLCPSSHSPLYKLTAQHHLYNNKVRTAQDTKGFTNAKHNSYSTPETKGVVYSLWFVLHHWSQSSASCMVWVIESRDKLLQTAFGEAAGGSHIRSSTASICNTLKEIKVLFTPSESRSVLYSATNGRCLKISDIHHSFKESNHL